MQETGALGNRVRRGERQVAALPVRRAAGRIEVLLVTTLDTGRWVIPKGWPWADVADHEAAAGEAREEAGVEGLARAESIGSYVYDKRRKDGTTTAVTVDVFVLEVTDELAKWPERKRRQRAWLAPDEAAARVQEDGLRAIIGSFPRGSTTGRRRS